MRILLLKFYYVFISFIAQILLSILLIRFYCVIVNSIVRIQLCGYN